MATPSTPVNVDPNTVPGLAFSPVTMELPSQRLFPGSWCDVAVKINQPPLKLEDLVFSVERHGNPADATCLISVAREARSSAAFRLLVGARPGAYNLLAKRRGTGEQLARTSFRVDPTVPLGDAGPSYWLRPTDGPPGVAIGGGPAGVANVGVIGNLRGVTWKVAVVLLEYKDVTFPAAAAARQAVIDRWTGMLLTGQPLLGAANASVKSFFEECSFGHTKIEGKVLGFATAKGIFLDYYKTDVTWPLPGKDGQPNPLPPGTKQYQDAIYKDFQALISEIDGVYDLSGFDSVFFVSPNHQPAGETFERFPWPYASGAKTVFKTSKTNPDGTIVSVDLTIGAFVMPDSFDMVKPTLTTICHELGHNFGMNDQYTPAVQAEKAGLLRNVGNWDPMDTEATLPHHSLFHKLALGWVVDPAASAADRDKIVRSIDFGKAGAGSETLKLAPLELACPPNFHHGLEIRIGQGRNYYFEYRRTGGAGTVGDRKLPESPVVLGIDAVTDPGGLLASRPQLLLLAFDEDGDSAVLSAGQDYVQSNIVQGDVPMALRLEVLGTQASHAEVKVSFEVLATPNPALTPWNTVPESWWQSPDIEIRNARSDADPVNFANKLWLGNSNRVIARVTNTGGADAPGVQVKFAVKDYTVGGGQEEDIGQDTNDVPAGAEVEFTTLFNAPAGAVEAAHYCVVARITPYLTPISKTLEANVYDNIAQSNYAGLMSVMASPPTRPGLLLAVDNPYRARARIYVQPAQSHGGFISYLSSRWLRLDGMARRKIRVATEYAPTPARGMQTTDQFDGSGVSPERLLGIRARLSLAGWAEAPSDGHPRRLAGADVDLQAGFRTLIDRVSSSSRTHSVQGFVLRTGGETKGRVAGGSILLVVAPGSRDRRTFTRKVNEKGQFSFSRVLAAPGTPFEIHYLGGNGEAPSSTTGAMDG